MSERVWQRPPERLLQVLGEESYRWLLQLERHIYGDTTELDGTLDAKNIRPIEQLKTEETNPYTALKPDGDAGLAFGPVPDGGVKFVTLESHASLPNARIATGGQNITITEDATDKTATWDVSPQGIGSLLDADMVDGRQAAEFVWSIGKDGDPLAGDVLIAEGTGITVTRTDQTLTIAATGLTADPGDELFASYVA